MVEKVMSPGSTTKLCLILLLMFLVFSLCFIQLASAQEPSFKVTIESPLSGETITGDHVNLHFRIDKTVNYAWVKTVSYYIYLDEDLYNQLNQTIITNNDVIIDKTIDLRIENVSQGKHTINVDVDIEYCPSSWIPLYQPAHVSSSLGLFVYKGIIPEISISDLDTHLTNQTTFRITTNLFDSTVSYSLDGSSNFTLPQNESSSLQNSYFYSVTVLGLSTGHHNITAYMKDALNHTAKAEETFTIGQPVPTLTIVAVVGAAIIAIASTVILLYRKSKNKTTSKT